MLAPGGGLEPPSEFLSGAEPGYIPVNIFIELRLRWTVHDATLATISRNYHFCLGCSCAACPDVLLPTYDSSKTFVRSTIFRKAASGSLVVFQQLTGLQKRK